MRQVWLPFGGVSQGAIAYLDVEILVDLEGPFEQEDVLGQIGKLPHVAQPLQWSLFFLRCLRLHLVPGALSGDHFARSVPFGDASEGGRFGRG